MKFRSTNLSIDICVIHTIMLDLFYFLVATFHLVAIKAYSDIIFESFQGNELEQFEKYVQLTKHINATDIFTRNDECERSIIPEKGFRFYNCRHTIREYLQTLPNMALVSHVKDPNDNSKLKRMCSYRVGPPTLSLSHSKHGVRSLLSFIIHQENCKGGSKLHSVGGSTFDIHVRSKQALAVCRTIDHFDNTYAVECLTPYSERPGLSRVHKGHGVTTTHQPSKICFFLEVILHFENYDAFYDVGIPDWTSLDYPVTQSSVCVSTESLTAHSPSAATLNRGAAGDPGHPAHFRGHFWASDRNTTSVGLISSSSSSTTTAAASSSHDEATSVVYPAPEEYHWKGARKKFLKVSAMKTCLKEQTIFFVGESHMRYQFDITMDRYVDRLRVGRYHGNMNISGISYMDMTFSARMARFIDTIQCSDNGARVTYVLQTGSWDLQFFGPRGFIDSAYQGNYVLRALKDLLARTTKSCPNSIQIIYISTMPHPWCVSGDAHCIRLMNYWRNNGAIRAVNQYMERQLVALGSNNIRVLDSHGVLHPRFSYKEFVCVDHFMCNDPPRGLVTTQSGVALAMEVLNLACENVISGRDNKQFYRDDMKYIDSQTQQAYVVSHGCRRLIPDSDTMKYFHIPSNQFESVSSDLLNDIPTCHRHMFPSRKSGTLLQLYSSKSVYVMDRGMRRQVLSGSIISELGQTFDNVTFVLEEDFNVIPLGKDLASKADCDECGRIV